MNKVILLGRLVADPELRFTQNNVPVCRFRIAINKPEAEAEFFRIVAWRGTAEFISKYFKKGSKILIEGHLKTHVWDDNGTKRYDEYTQADQVYFVDSKKAENQESAPEGQSESYYQLSDEGLPF
ncbi:MAG: single-stranded DNA-binding protein [Clostridiaceae bacterium]|nr:single-stranded DNA-binding protein [Clostridiaceae bacterium]